LARHIDLFARVGNSGQPFHKQLGNLHFVFSAADVFGNNPQI